MKKKFLISLGLLITGAYLAANDEDIKRYRIDPDKSTINWKGTKPSGHHTGTVDLSEGYIILTDGKLTDGKFIIDFNSIVNEDVESPEWNKKLVDHLKSADFFHVEKYPSGSFEISAVDDLGNSRYWITGFLTMKNVSKKISFEASLIHREGTIQARSEEIILDRVQWNIEAMSKTIFSDIKENYVDDEMVVDVELVTE